MLGKSELYLSEWKTDKSPSPKKLKANPVHTTACKYIGSLEPSDWKAIDIRHSDKGVLTGLFHFVEVYIWDKSTNTVGNRLLVISKRKTREGEEIRYSSTNASLGQYTEQAVAYMQAQRFFLEHSFKEQKQVSGMVPVPDTQMAAVAPPNCTDMMVGCFMLKEELLNQDGIAILSARDIMDFLFFKFYKEMTEERLRR